MNIVIGSSYWHTRFNTKVWVRSVVAQAHITEDVNGNLYLAFSDELVEIEE